MFNYLLLIVCTISRVCGKPIVDGVEIDSGEIKKYTYMSSLQEWSKISPNDSFTHFCGGAIIHPKWILTAAHCVDGKNPKKMAIVIGAKSVNLKNELRYNVTQIEFHGYNKYALRNDIALVKIDLDDSILKALPIYTGSLPYGEKCKIIGYGAKQYSGKTPNPLSMTYVNLITNFECARILGHIMGPKMENVCALGVGGADTCQGDSGGPLICEKDNTEYVVGITSSGSGCGIPGVPSLYTLIEPFAEWIDYVINNM